MNTFDDPSLLRLPMGYDDMGAILDNHFSMVDKSLFIREVLEDKAQIVLITRPRRFGKTLGLSLLRYFFSKEVLGRPTERMFDGLKISQYPELMTHQGKYPVVSLTFKEITDEGYPAAYAGIAQIMSNLYDEHRVLLASNTLHTDEKEVFEAILKQKAPETLLRTALFRLTKYLHRHFDIKPIVLIDEYDTPIQSAYLNGYYDEMIAFMRYFLGSVLKNNLYLHKAVLTGILRVAKESLFSGLNNLEVYTLLRPEYREFFGFTEEEVLDLLKRAHLMAHVSEVKHWYDGYRMWELHVYNPWSIVHCINRGAVFQPYWVNTSDNALVKQLLGKATPDLKTLLESLVSGQSIRVMVDENIVFGDLKTHLDSIWNLLLMSGYLTVVSQRITEEGLIEAELIAPNMEIRGLYRRQIQEWFTDPLGAMAYESLLKTLVLGEIEEFEARLQQCLAETVSFFDITGKEPERFYHGLVLGLLVGLDKTHRVTSNRESGFGRYDVMIIPKNTQTHPLGILIEFKKTRTHAALPKEARAALAQIHAKNYALDLKKSGVSEILSLGIAFYKKSLEMRSKRIVV